MQPRVLAVAVVSLVVLASVPFAVHPTSGGSPSAVPLENTKRTGLSGAAVRRASNSPIVIPKAEAYYSQYRYVVGYQGVTSLVASLRARNEREFGRPLALYVSDFSGTDVGVSEAGYLRMAGNRSTKNHSTKDRSAEPTKWVPARDAYFVINSSARVPASTTTIVPFSKRADAAAFARRYGGSVRTWPAVKRLPVGRADRSARAWQRVVDRRRTNATRSVERTQPALDRPVSVVVGRDAPTIARALDRAPPNTTIVVPPGTYRVDTLRVRKPVTIRGAGPNRTHVIGDRNGSVVSVSTPRTAVTSLSIAGVGQNRSGANRSISPAEVSVEKGSWRYQYWKIHGFGDAAIVFDDASRSLVSNVHINTTSNGIIARNSAGTTVSRLRLYGTKQWQEGFIGVVALGSPVVVQDSELYGGKVGVYAYDAPRTVVRNSSMEGMMIGVFDLYSSQLLVADNTIEDTWNAIYIETRSYASAVVGNRVENSRNGIVVEGRANYIANDTAVRNRNGITVQGQYSLYRHNTLAYNRVGARGLSSFPTNRVTANDIAHNREYVEMRRSNILHIWRGNYWSGASGTDWDGDGRLSSAFRPTGPVDRYADRVRGTPTLARSPALRVLRRLQGLMPGFRSGGVLDPRPRVGPVRPSVLRRLDSVNGTGRYDDPDPWDFYGV